MQRCSRQTVNTRQLLVPQTDCAAVCAQRHRVACAVLSYPYSMRSPAWHPPAVADAVPGGVCPDDTHTFIALPCLSTHHSLAATIQVIAAEKKSQHPPAVTDAIPGGVSPNDTLVPQPIAQQPQPEATICSQVKRGVIILAPHTHETPRIAGGHVASAGSSRQ
jgi:hypothetical protein